MMNTECFDLLFNNLQNGLLISEVIDTKKEQYLVLSINDLYSKILSIPKDLINNILMDDLLQLRLEQINIDEFKTYYKQVIDTKQVIQTTIEIKNINESIITFWDAKYIPIIIDNNVKYIIYSITNITDLIIANTELQQSNLFLEQTAYTAAHDLKVPIRNITAFGMRIKKEIEHYTNNDKIQTYLTYLLESISYADKIVTATIDYSKYCNIKKVYFENCNISEIISIAKKNLLTNITNTQTRITTNIPTNLIIKANKNQLILLFMNLINNGIQHNNKKFKKIIINYEQLTNNMFNIHITDNGNGIDISPLTSIFDPFKKTSTSEGSGIGLSIVKRIIEQHKWKIDVKTIINKQTTFIITLQ